MQETRYKMQDMGNRIQGTGFNVLNENTFFGKKATFVMLTKSLPRTCLADRRSCFGEASARVSFNATCDENKRMPSYPAFTLRHLSDINMMALRSRHEPRRKMNRYLLLISFFLLVTGVFAQTAPADIIGTIMNNERVGVHTTVDDKILYQQENTTAVLNHLQPYYGDTLAAVRYRAYKITHRAGQASPDEAAVKKSVSMLAEAVSDKDSGNSGAVMTMLTGYRAEDFDDNTREKLLSYVEEGKSHLDKLLMLTGFVPAKGSAARIKQMIAAGSLRTGKLKWSAYLSLARMGDADAINTVMEKVQALPVNDDFVYEIAPDLIYTHQKRAVDYLVEILKSDSQDCTSSDPDNSRPILCGYRLIEYLAPVIKDYPFALDVSGDLEVEDYRQALADVREWFGERGSSYELVSDRY